LRTTEGADEENNEVGVHMERVRARPLPSLVSWRRALSPALEVTTCAHSLTLHEHSAISSVDGGVQDID
jgi:hypothetical protein